MLTSDHVNVAITLRRDEPRTTSVQQKLLCRPDLQLEASPAPAQPAFKRPIRTTFALPFIQLPRAARHGGA